MREALTREELLFSLGLLTGELARDKHRRDFVAMLSAPVPGNDRVAGYLILLRDQITALLRDSGIEPDLTDMRIVEIRDAHLPSQGEPFDCIAFARDLLKARLTT